MSRRTVQSATVGLNSCERIRPERPRNTIQRLVWSPGTQFPTGNIGVPEDDGTNPRMALRRFLRLYEGRQYREAAAFLQRLPIYTLKSVLPDIPVDLLIDSLPHSLALLEALYSRLAELGITDTKIFRTEQILWRVVQLISASQDHFRLRSWCKLLGALHRLAPNTRGCLISRRRALERAVEGLGKHGLVPTSKNTRDDSKGTANLLPLPVALKDELEARLEAYKLALHKIESCGKHAGANKGDQGVQAASHQRQLSLKYSEIQQRLIDNQSLLNTLEKAADSRILENLLAELKRRVEQDKEALRQWTALRKSNLTTNAKNPALAARLLQFAKGCTLALQLMNDDNSEVHFEENGLDEYEEESSSAGYHTDESCSPTPEPAVSRGLATISGSNIVQTDFTSSTIIGVGSVVSQKNFTSERKFINSTTIVVGNGLQKNFANSAHGSHLVPKNQPNVGHLGPKNLPNVGHLVQKSFPNVGVVQPNVNVVQPSFANSSTYVALQNSANSNGEDVTAERLAERYGALYAHAHLHTLDALDALQPLKDAPELKAKILYSVVVLSWRLAGIIQTSRKLEALSILNGGKNSSETTPELEDCIKRQLATSGWQTGSEEVAEQVVSQLERTLYDFPCLRGSAEIKRYALASATLAWACLARATPLVLDVAQGLDFRRDVHVRHHASPDSNGTRIKAVLWPGLREGCQGPCLHRAVVLTTY